MSQPATSSRLTNSAVNIIGATGTSTNYGVTGIGVTGNNFDISALSTSNNVSIGANGTRNVTIGSAASGTVTFAGATTFSSPINGGVFTGTAINGTLVTTPLLIGNNLTTGSVSIANTGTATTVTIGNNSTTGTGTVNVGTGSATVNVGNNATTSPTAIVLGRTGGSVTLGPPLTLGAAPNGVTGIASAAASPYLGNFYKLPVDTVLQVNNSAQVSLTIGTPGIYLLCFCIQLTCTVTPTDFFILMTGANILNNMAFGSARVNLTNISSIGSIVVSCTASNYALVVNYTGGSGMTVNVNSFFQATRIG